MGIAEFGVVLLLADIKPFKGFLMGPIAPEKADARVNRPIAEMAAVTMAA